MRLLQLAYFERHEERLHSPDFLRRGHPIGSGAVGDACKHVIADRFDGSGMRWKPGTADPLMRVRAALLTQPRWDLRSYSRDAFQRTALLWAAAQAIQAGCDYVVR